MEKSVEAQCYIKLPFERRTGYDPAVTVGCDKTGGGRRCGRTGILADNKFFLVVKVYACKTIRTRLFGDIQEKGTVPEPKIRISGGHAAFTGVAGVVTFVIGNVKLSKSADLREIIETGDRPSPVPCLLQGWQQHGRQDGDDGNNDKKLDQGEAHGLHPALAG